MHRRPFLDDLREYTRSWGAGLMPYEGLSMDEERATPPLFEALVKERADCFERSCAPGHITGSALIVSPDLGRVLLTLHGKLNKWLQLGGHADGEPSPFAVASREAEEESGLTKVTALHYEDRIVGKRPHGRPLPFDLDRHLIPARGAEPAHYHYDVRYVLLADPHHVLGITEESRDLRWFTLAKAHAITAERSMHRQFAKVAWLKTQKLP